MGEPTLKISKWKAVVINLVVNVFLNQFSNIFIAIIFKPMKCREKKKLSTILVDNCGFNSGGDLKKNFKIRISDVALAGFCGSGAEARNPKLCLIHPRGTTVTTEVLLHLDYVYN